MSPNNQSHSITVGVPITEWPARVSDQSLWDDDTWVLPSGAPGSLPVDVRWRFSLHDGRWSTDPEWRNLLSLCKRFVWSLIAQNASGPALKSPTVKRIADHLKVLVKWMAKGGVQDFASLDPLAVRGYVFWLNEEQFNGRIVNVHTVSSYLDVLVKIFHQRFALSSDPSAVLSYHPFGNSAPYRLARDHFEVVSSKKRPLTPDEVVQAIVSRAVEWLDAPARDIIRVSDVFFTARDIALGSGDHDIIFSALENFVFDDNGRQVQPWRGPIRRNKGRLTAAQAHLPKRDNRRHPRLVLQSLIHELIGACSIVLQGLIGMRCGEVCGLLAGPRDEATGWPACLSIGKSRTGMHEIFYIEGRQFKEELSERYVKWLAGSRLAGTDYLPPTVKAVLVIDKLLSIWKDIDQTPELFVTVKMSSEFTTFEAHALHFASLLRRQQYFIQKHVQLPDEHQRWNLTPSQWRRAFAMFMVRTDPRLLPAVSDHFKHVNLVVTEQGYLDSDPDLMGVIDDVDAMETAKFLAGVHLGSVTATGPLAELMWEHWTDIDEQLSKFVESKDKVDAFLELVREENFRVFPADWGKCFYRAEVARCHHDATGSFQTSQKAPNYLYRRPDICCSCSNLIVSEEQMAFWKKRHLHNLRVHKANIDDGNEALAQLAAMRLETSGAVLRKLRVDLSDLDGLEPAHGH